MTKHGSIREGSVYEDALVSRVFYRTNNKNGHLSAIFRCCWCSKDFERTLSNQRRSPYKTCNNCSIDLSQESKKVFNDYRHTRDLYGIWKSMNTRCSNPLSSAFVNYGARGINVCEEWRDNKTENYYNFLDHVYPRPSDKHSLERVDNSKGYSPDNVIWAVQEVQMNNVRTNHIVQYEGVDYTVTSLARKYNIKPNTLLYRLRRGWSVEEAIKGKKLKAYKRPYSDTVDDQKFYLVMKDLIDGVKTNTEAARILGVDSGNLSRVKRREEVIKWVEDYDEQRL